MNRLRHEYERLRYSTHFPMSVKRNLMFAEYISQSQSISAKFSIEERVDDNFPRYRRQLIELRKSGSLVVAAKGHLFDYRRNYFGYTVVVSSAEDRKIMWKRRIWVLPTQFFHNATIMKLMAESEIKVLPNFY